MNTLARKFLLIPLGALLALGGCASVAPTSAAPDNVAWVSPEYLIGTDDVVSVSVWQNPELATAGPVRADGKITVALIGDVQAGGRTPAAVGADIREAMKAFVREPQVTVLLTDLKSHEYLSRVRVTGAVRQPVSLPYRQGMTVLDAVLAAGGTTDFAAADRTSLHRRRSRDGAGDGGSYTVALGSILDDGDLSSNYAVQPGDVITVPQRSF